MTNTEAPKTAAAAEVRGPIAGLILGALGVVYGDIGTSPLYTLKTALDWAGDASANAAAGMFSLIVWTLIITTSIKYAALVMRADNDGEGGILALTAKLALKGQERRVLVVIGILGAALLYGDGAITPAISVLSALEGLKQPFPGLARFILPAATVILIALFVLQQRGTATIGKIFGPVMIVWFACIGILGVRGIITHPAVLFALNPMVGVTYIATHGFAGFTLLGAVFLSATGAEALYADMGHFGRKPIRIGWYALVLPMLLLNYAGQAAVVATGPVSEGANPFFLLAPDWLQLPLVVLATAATIIASQAIISGVFSMTRQAIQLGLCPRLTVTQTSATGYGQIYVGVVNWLLMVFTLGLTIGFGSSDKLAAAFGIAVSLTMLLTTILMYKLMREQWQWSLMKALAVAGPLLLVDCTFSSANLVKVTEGGWVPLAAAAIVFTIMDAWRSGRIALIRELQRNTTPMSAFINSMKGEARVQGTAVYLTQQLNNVPIALLHNVKHYHVLHWRNILLTVDTEHIPRVPPESRVHFVDLGHEFYNIQLHYGFMEHRDIPLALAEAMPAHAPFDLMNTTFFVSRASIERAPQKNRLNAFFRGLFTWLHRNESDATEFFHIPRNRMVELGTRVEV